MLLKLVQITFPLHPAKGNSAIARGIVHNIIRQSIRLSNQLILHQGIPTLLQQSLAPIGRKPNHQIHPSLTRTEIFEPLIGLHMRVF